MSSLGEFSWKGIILISVRFSFFRFVSCQWFVGGPPDEMLEEQREKLVVLLQLCFSNTKNKSLTWEQGSKTSKFSCLPSIDSLLWYKESVEEIQNA